MSQAERLAVEASIRSALGKQMELAELRPAYDRLCQVTPPPVGSVLESRRLNGVSVEVATPESIVSDRSILYFHGGGHMVGSLVSHRGLVTHLGDAAGMRTFAVDFRLAPEHVYPAALDDALAVYRWVLDSGMPSTSIALAGDSAGAGLALATWLRARDEGLPPPAALALFSPFVDLTGSSPSIQDADRDIMVTVESVHAVRRVYLADGDPKAPYASPLFGDLRGLPPSIIHVGSSERLLHDSIRLAQSAGAADALVELKIWPHMPHVWQIFAAVLEEGRQSLSEAGAFLAAAMDAGEE